MSRPMTSIVEQRPMMQQRCIFIIARGGEAVGTSGQLAIAARWFFSRGWDVHVAVLSAGGGLIDRLIDAGVIVHAVGNRCQPDMAAWLRLASLLRRHNPNIVQTWGSTAARWGLSAAHIAGRAKTVACLAVEPRTREPLMPLLQRASRVVVCSDSLKESWLTRGLGSNRVIVVPPGISAGLAMQVPREDVARELGLLVDRPWTLCVAPLESNSRIEAWLWAVDQLDVVCPGIEHVIVGNGPLKNKLRRWAKIQNIDARVHARTECRHVTALLPHLRLVWQAGNVAYGGAILDAMAEGVPAVAVDSPAARQLIADNQTGRIVTARPASELPRRSLEVIESDDCFNRYSIASRERVEKNFPIHLFEASHESIIEQLL